MRIALVPLDERPVNIQLPRQVAAIAGVELLIPPVDALPAFRTPADVDALHGWLRELAAVSAGGDGADRLVVCIDTLVHGGIIPARITGESPRIALERLDLLRELHDLRAADADNPALTITAASLVMRASDSYSAVEEPDYWSTYGRALHAFGGALHHALEADLLSGEPPQAPAVAVPRAEQSDFERRRLRNHIINLAALGLHEEGVIDALAVTADDTADFSAGSVEQAWLRHWARALPRGSGVMMYPGADEVGAVLVARALVGEGPRPRWRIACGEQDGLTRVPNFENAPVYDSLVRQITAAGGVVADDDPVDAVLVAHAPDPDHGDCFGGVPPSDPAAVEATVSAVRDALASGAIVALADVRYSNGSDPVLVDRLAAEGLLLQLTSYGGWNTAGNAIGGAVAEATAWWVGRRDGTADPRALREALLTRILDDHVYQSGIRPALHEPVFGGTIGPVDEATEAEALRRIGAELQSRLDEVLAGDTAGDDPWTVVSVALPWHRSFEIDIALARR